MVLSVPPAHTTEDQRRLGEDGASVSAGVQWQPEFHCLQVWGGEAIKQEFVPCLHQLCVLIVFVMSWPALLSETLHSNCVPRVLGRFQCLMMDMKSSLGPGSPMLVHCGLDFFLWSGHHHIQLWQQ